MSSSDPVPTPVSALDAPLKKYDDMTAEEKGEFDRAARKREQAEQAGWLSISALLISHDCAADFLGPALQRRPRIFLIVYRLGADMDSTTVSMETGARRGRRYGPSAERHTSQKS